MLSRNTISFELGYFGNRRKGRSHSPKGYSFNEWALFSLQRVLRLLLHHLSLEEVALDQRSHNFHFGTMRVTHCGDLVSASLIHK